jgi:hypothetical protein
MVKGLKINGEYWLGKITTVDQSPNPEISYDMVGYYGEAMYEVGKFTPFVRYDHVEDVSVTIYLKYPDSKLFSYATGVTAYSVGLGFRPIYEVLMKAEYRMIDATPTYSDQNIPVMTATKMDPSNPLNIEKYKYNYYGLSLVYSF